MRRGLLRLLGYRLRLRLQNGLVFRGDVVLNFIPGIRAWRGYSYNGFEILLVVPRGAGYVGRIGDGYGYGHFSSYEPVFLPDEGHR